MHNLVMSESGSNASSGARLSGFLDRVVPLLRALSNDQRISPSAASLLALVSRAGRARVTELARLQGVSQPAMTQLVRRLAGDGLVTRTDGAGGRATWVELAPAGREVLDVLRGRRRDGLVEMLARLDEADRAAVDGALPALERLLVLGEALRGPDRSPGVEPLGVSADDGDATDAARSTGSVA